MLNTCIIVALGGVAAWSGFKTLEYAVALGMAVRDAKSVGAASLFRPVLIQVHRRLMRRAVAGMAAIALAAFAAGVVAGGAS